MTSADFDSATRQNARALIRMALEEDLADRGDLTSAATIPADRLAAVNIGVREDGIVSGLPLIEEVFRLLAESQPSCRADKVQIHISVDDGSPVVSGTIVANLSGNVRTLLTAERTVLNFLIHLSGIATRTAEFVQRTAGSKAVILDTRKTLPGWRLLHKYAVRCGGGTNHRMGLYDGILIKDNHLAARGNRSVADAVQAARDYLKQAGLHLAVEVEVDTLDQLRDALAATPEIVLLDNMNPSTLQQAVTIRNELSPDTLLEASGGVTLESVGCTAAAGVDRISIGGLTHSAPALDLGFDWSL